MDLTPDVAALRRLIQSSRRAVVFTGAGISTESGIPDFRSPTGIWARMKPIDFRDYVASAAARRDAWGRKFANDPHGGTQAKRAGCAGRHSPHPVEA
ncbi:MAG: NAD-dependent protein deacetylase of SIR2 family [uncultured Acetobacteraceae bacterium]|uniref:protein acetyllysine N-acetyltransferase n=1 Tax=uncultured Acetobacteraceae bacterium TaxID=169975 RepID=A0A6J4ISK9_9PROT|nr:MAG: NAD-dependent protein deacetylase of SIR2 family [uncultured Acetobacteraceae bacterium]